MRLQILKPAIVLVLIAAPAFGQQKEYLKSNDQVKGALADVVAKSTESTVRVRCGDADAALGTVVGTDGWILTKFSELKGDPICKLKDGREFPAKIFSVQPQFDVALLKIDAKNLPVAEWRESKDDGVGSWVASPGITKLPIAVGVISVASRNIDARATRRYTPSRDSGFLGVQMAQGDTGVLIDLVTPDTPAAKVGLKQGDLIKFIDGKPVKDVDTMAEILGKHRPKDKVVIKFERGGKPMEVTPELTIRPADRGLMQNTMGGKLSDRRTGFPTILQHDTVLSPNDCGGPLVDLDGRVVGVNIARAGRTETYAIPAEKLQSLVVDMEAGKYPPPKLSVFDIFGPQITEAELKVHQLQNDKADVEKRMKETEEAKRKQEQKLKDDAELLKKQDQKIKDAEEELRKIQDKFEKAKQAEEKKAPDKKLDDKKTDDKKPE